MANKLRFLTIGSNEVTHGKSSALMSYIQSGLEATSKRAGITAKSGPNGLVAIL